MSDPVSNHDIEDVLSSIRRLVAQGDPKQARAAANAPTPLHAKPPVIPVQKAEVAEPAPVGRLVLTPAFRVSDEADQAPVAEKAPQTRSFDTAIAKPESDTIPTKDTRPMPPPVESPTERASLEATIAELEAAVSTRKDDWEPDGSEMSQSAAISMAFMASPRVSKDVPAKPKPPVAELKAAPTPEAPKAEDNQSNSSEAAVTSAVADHIAATVAEELEEAFPHLQAADEPSHLDDDVETVEPVSIVQPIVEEAPAQVQPIAEEVEIVEAVDVEIEEPSVVETLTFRRTSSVQEVYDPVAEATADAAEAAPDAGDIYGDELAPDPEETGTAVATPASTPLMDPDMLRSMVGDMIREELQGEMGERITRNVRKLVRREINRVISAQEFD